MLIHILTEPDAEGVRHPAEVDESLLVKTEGVYEDDNERTTWVEYRYPGQDLIVHRSAHVTIKQAPEIIQAVAAKLG